jgi:hypothetical protein
MTQDFLFAIFFMKHVPQPLDYLTLNYFEYNFDFAEIFEFKADPPV